MKWEMIKVKVSIGVSARHVHLTKEDLDILFGENYELTKKKDLTQPGQFSCEEQVILEGPKRKIENVRILGPLRSKTQVELSKTDAYGLGINAPVRNSGDLDDAKEIKIIGPKGEIVRNAAIIATRHLHATEEDVIKYGLKDRKFVSLKLGGEKGGVLEKVHIRVDNNFKFEVHLDLDDANAFLVKNGDIGELFID